MTSMVPSTFFIKQGDTAPVITATLIDAAGNVANLTGASVKFIMTNSFYGNAVNATATIVNASLGQVSYQWQSASSSYVGDTGNTGTFSCQWYVVYSSGAQESFPQGFYDTVQIDPNLTSGFLGGGSPTPLFNTIWNSSSSPGTLQGNNGDYWFNTATSTFYGPKVNGVWPAGIPVGSAGTALNTLGAPTANVNMNQWSFNNLAYINAAPASISQTALTVNAPAGSTVDVVDVELNTVKYWYINNLGNFNGIGQLNLAPSSTSLTPLVVNSPTSTSVDVADFQINGVTQWNINSTGTLGGIGQLNLSPTSTSISPLLVNVPSGSSANVATFRVNSSTAWSIGSAGTLAGTKPLTVTPTSTSAVSATLNNPSGTSVNIANFQTNGSTLASVSNVGQVTGVTHSVTGLTGATVASRYVGGTSGGAPVSGTFTVGDYVVDTVNGTIYICVTSGSPGTWTSVSQGGTRILATPISTTSNGTATSGTTETFDTSLGSGTGYYQCSLVSGVRYRVVYDGLIGNGTASGVEYAIQIRNSGTSSTPTSASTLIAQTNWSCAAAGTIGRTPIPLRLTFVAASTGINTFGLSATAPSGVFTPVSSSTAREFYVELA